MSDDLSPHPTDFDRLEGFKAAWYGEHGAGSWLDDIKLSLVYYDKREEPLPDHLQEIVDMVRDDDE